MKKGFAVFTFAVLVLLLSSCTKFLFLSLEVAPKNKEPVLVERNIMVEMPDGVRLATDVYRPKSPGKYPAILCRLPYGSDSAMFSSLAKLFVSQGYIFVVQDTRGTYDSEGVYFPLIFEREDGKHTCEWIARQPWFNGKLGSWGVSYFAYTQWAMAPDNKILTAMNPVFGTGNIFQFVFRGGALTYVQMIPWNTNMQNKWYEKQGINKRIKINLLKGGYYNQPIRPAQSIDIDAILSDPERTKKEAEHGAIKFLTHPGDIYPLPALNFDKDYSQVSAVGLLIAGWYDQATGPMLEDFVRIRSEGIGNARKTRMIIGPWVHGAPGLPPNPRFHQGPFAGMKFYTKELLSFYDYWLKGINNGEDKKPPLKIFIMGENKWRDEYEWPLARTQWTNFYLHSRGNANSKKGDGWLSTTPPEDEPFDQYNYDPENPVPTKGGNFLGYKQWKPGAFNQAEIEKREDVLVYMTEPLTEPVEITGPIRMILYAKSSARDTDFTAKLVDVYPSGYVQNLCDGIIRARYRNGYMNPSPIEPGKVYRYEIDMWATSNLFKPGHRIGVEISSSNFPQYDRNTNCAGERPDCIKIAHQVIYHNRKYPSHIILPVIPR